MHVSVRNKNLLFAVNINKAAILADGHSPLGSLYYIMKRSPPCTPEKSKIFLADGHSPYHRQIK